MENENKQVLVEADLYDNVLEGVALFTGIFVGVITRYATTVIVPQNDTLMKRVFRESGSIAVSTAAMNVTSQSIKVIGAYLKPYVMRK